jgi:uncharacterized protein YidB (DUF937 family)
MGLLDSLENEAVTKMLGGSSSPAASCVLQMIQNQPGGLQGLVQNLHNNGLGSVAQSWIGNGQNLPISSDQIHQVLGSDQVKALAAKCGISPDAAGGAIAQLLPGIVDKLTPNGQVPAHNSVMDMVGGMLQNLEKAS